ncbi:MAG: hypothetical protein QXH34_06435, partial [Ignisphaera sp.]
MLKSCSPSSILSEIISVLNTISDQCSSLGENSLSEELNRIRILRDEYLCRCYRGSIIDQDLLSWMAVAEKGLESCISIRLNREEITAAETLRLVRYIVEMTKLLEMGVDRISMILLEGKRDRAKEIKRLYLAGIGDLIERVNDESIKHVLETLWNSLKSDLKRGVEMYAIKKGLINLALRVEVLQDEGLPIEDPVIQLTKSMLTSLIHEVKLTLAHRGSRSEVKSSIEGYL